MTLHLAVDHATGAHVTRHTGTVGEFADLTDPLRADAAAVCACEVWLHDPNLSLAADPAAAAVADWLTSLYDVGARPSERVGRLLQQRLARPPASGHAGLDQVRERVTGYLDAEVAELRSTADYQTYRAAALRLGTQTWQQLTRRGTLPASLVALADTTPPTDLTDPRTLAAPAVWLDMSMEPFRAGLWPLLTDVHPEHGNLARIPAAGLFPRSLPASVTEDTFVRTGTVLAVDRGYTAAQVAAAAQVATDVHLVPQLIAALEATIC